jgi:hypothetical protein
MPTGKGDGPVFGMASEATTCLSGRKVTTLIKPVYGDLVSVVQACSI